MNDTSIASFLSVARTGSFTTSAADLSSTQQAVSRNVQSLEEELGFPLLDRSGRVVELTWEGTRFYNWCMEVDRQLTKSEAAASRSMGHSNNVLRIGWCDWTGCPTPLAEIIRDFKAGYPDCILDFRQGNFKQVTGFLAEQTIDIAILPEFFTHNDLGLAVSEPFMQLPLYVATGEQQLCFRTETPTIAELTPVKQLAAHYGGDTDDDVRLRCEILCASLGIYAEHIEVLPNVDSTLIELLCGPCYTIIPRIPYAERIGGLHFYPLGTRLPLVLCLSPGTRSPWTSLFESFVRGRSIE